MVSLFRKNSIVSTILNLLGMTAAFAAMYVIFVQVHHDFTYNHGIKDSDRIYVMTLPDFYEEGKYSVFMNRPPQEKVLATATGIESGGCGQMLGSDCYISLKEGSDKIDATFNSLTPGTVKAFGYELVQGSFDDMKTWQQTAISESFARKTGLAPGSTYYQISRGRSVPMTVVAIYKDFPAISDLASNDGFSLLGDQDIYNTSEWSYCYYVKLNPSENKEDFEKEAFEIAKEFYMNQFPDDSTEADDLNLIKYRLVSIRDAYFDPLLARGDSMSGNKSTTYTLLAIAILILLISMVNYVNFFVAMIPLRIKGINIRKVIGASRTSLVMGMIGESLLLTFISLALSALVVIFFGKSHLADLIPFTTGFGSNPLILALTVGVAILVAIVASLYPALYSTSVPPALSLKGSFSATHKGKAIRYSLVGVQFTISMALIICAIFINKQRSFMLNHDLGFDKENLLVVSSGYSVGSQRADVEERLKKNPDIKDVAWADGDMVAASRMGWGREVKGQQRNWQCYPVSWNFLRFMNIPVQEGRDFQESDEQCENGIFIFNEAAKKEFGLTLEDKVGGHMDIPTDIAGFCADFNYAPLRSAVAPFSFYVFGKDPWRPLSTLFVRTAPGCDFTQLRKFIGSTLAEYDSSMSADDFDIKLFDQTLQKVYDRESKLSKLITLFTIIAIIISLMGVFGLVMIETEGRMKEIGIRRVNGSTIEEILLMINSKFIYIVLGCFVVAAPLCMFIMRRYLQNFAYRISLSPWVFLLALLAVLFVTVCVVTLESLRAATSNPVDSLRNE